jgi:hypothetical protein
LAAVGHHTFTITRRGLLLGAAATLVTAACSSKGSDKPDISVSPSTSTGGTGLNLLVPSTLLLAGGAQRIALLLAQDDNTFITPAGSVELAFAQTAGADAGKFDAFAPAAVHTDAGGAPAYVTIDHTFPTAGNYWVQARYSGKTAQAALAIYDPADPIVAQIPAVGQPLIRVATPTPSDHRGVEPICTRTPGCPWHEPSLDAALDEHKPTAVLFSTPKLCQTAVCGPVLDTLLGLKAEYEGKGVRFLHVEVYADGSGTNPNPPIAPAMKAYHLQGEPMLFVAGSDGKVVHRIDGLFGTGEARAALDLALGTK